MRSKGPVLQQEMLPPSPILGNLDTGVGSSTRVLFWTPLKELNHAAGCVFSLGWAIVDNLQGPTDIDISERVAMHPKLAVLPSGFLCFFLHMRT